MGTQRIENDISTFLDKNRHLTMQNLADLLGVSRGWISMLANGHRQIPQWMPLALRGLQQRPRLRKKA